MLGPASPPSPVTADGSSRPAPPLEGSKAPKDGVAEGRTAMEGSGPRLKAVEEGARRSPPLGELSKVVEGWESKPPPVSALGRVLRVVEGWGEESLLRGKEIRPSPPALGTAVEEAATLLACKLESGTLPALGSGITAPPPAALASDVTVTVV